MPPDVVRSGAMRARGWRVALTGAGERDRELAMAIAAEGGVALLRPVIAYEPVPASPELDAVLGRLARYDWVVFTSATAVEYFAVHHHARAARLPRLAAVGPATARAARAALGAPALVSVAQTGQGLAVELLAAGAAGHVLLPAADIASPRLAEELRDAGVAVDALTVYRTIAAPGAAELADHIAAGAVDVVLLASPSAARALAEAIARTIPDRPARVPPVACIGPTTAAEAARVGFDVAATAARHDRPGLLHALFSWIELHPELHHAVAR